MERWILLICVVILFSCRKNNFTSENHQISVDDNSARVSGISDATANTATLDKNIRYFGRWDLSNTAQYSSYWGGAYLKVKFSGQTVKIKVDNSQKTNYYVKIDGGKWTGYLDKSGVIDLTPVPLANGVHTLSVAQGKDYSYVFKFQGLILGSGSTTSAPTVSKTLIEYIGDSITTGYLTPDANVSDFAWMCAESLNAEHIQIAYPGICLVNGYPGPGMVAQYVKQRSPAYLSSANWDFSRYTPNIVVCNLGFNDDYRFVPDALFKSAYVVLLKTVRAKFPNAQIFVMRTLTGVKSVPTQAAVNARVAASDRKVHYINTDGWLTPTDYIDTIHPTLNGHVKIASRLKTALTPYVFK